MMLSIIRECCALQYKSIEFQYNNNKRCCGNAWNLSTVVRKPLDLSSNNIDNAFGYTSSLSYAGGVSFFPSIFRTISSLLML